jgi:hypothetical protein
MRHRFGELSPVGPLVRSNDGLESQLREAQSLLATREEYRQPVTAASPSLPDTDARNSSRRHPDLEGGRQRHGASNGPNRDDRIAVTAEALG